MRTDWNALPHLKHRGAQLVVAVAGVFAILASTGGGGFPGFSDTCIGCGTGPITFPPAVYVSPTRTIVQVGMPVTFSAYTTHLSNPTFQWCRQPRDGNACVGVPGGTGSSYTLASPSLADDGADFHVTARGNEGSASSGPATLRVSSMPAVVFEDGEFVESEWIVASASTPPQNGPSFTVARIPTGGNPGAFRKVTYSVPSAPGTVRVFHGRLPATYFPTSQGAIYMVEFAVHCGSLSPDFAGLSLKPMLEQGDRRYAALAELAVRCSPGSWSAVNVEFLEREFFRLEDGPACGAAEACPDFSASAAPIRFGFASGVVRSSGGAATLQHGFDNWKMTVWRR